MVSTAVQLLVEDPDLGVGLDPQRFMIAENEVRASVLVIPRGRWEASDWPPAVVHGPGLLILEGTVVRQRGVEGRASGELLGAGDIIRPWQAEDSTVGGQASWRSLGRTRVAVLDVDFVRRIAPYPEIVGALMARAVKRSRGLGITIAILHQPRVDLRLHMLLWHVAERWGVVRADGVHVPLPLTHELLASLVAARRPTVSSALSELARQGLVERVSDGWLLHDARPGELAELDTTTVPHPVTG